MLWSCHRGGEPIDWTDDRTRRCAERENPPIVRPIPIDLNYLNILNRIRNKSIPLSYENKNFTYYFKIHTIGCVYLFSNLEIKYTYHNLLLIVFNYILPKNTKLVYTKLDEQLPSHRYQACRFDKLQTFGKYKVRLKKKTLTFFQIFKSNNV